ncbi:TraR/DksA C4-type zinc finger protein [bacterium]|nr:TraR/DksA C4-type zinc finger protein [bacterium]
MSKTNMKFARQNVGTNMKKTQKKKIYQEIFNVLTQKRSEILESIGSDASVLNQLQQDQSGDVVDFASGSSCGEMSSQLAEVETRELKNINAAIKRINDGSYGVCEGCKQDISADRLQAIPHTLHCISCQRVAEEADLNPSEITDWSLVLDDAATEFENGTSFSV